MKESEDEGHPAKDEDLKESEDEGKLSETIPSQIPSESRALINGSLKFYTLNQYKAKIGGPKVMKAKIVYRTYGGKRIAGIIAANNRG